MQNNVELKILRKFEEWCNKSC